MRLIGTLLVALAVAVAGCASDGAGEVATTKSGRPTASTSEGETPTPGPVVTPTADGSGWRYVYVSEQPDSELLDAAAAGPREAWAVGTASGKVLLLRYDGSNWRQVEPPAGLGAVPAGSQVRVAASAPDNVWLLAPKRVTGDQVDSMAAFRWDGSRWQEVGAELDTGDVADFAVLGPGDAWTVHGVGQPYARHWDGQAWRKVRLPADAQSLSGTGPGDLWAVGARHEGPAITNDEMSQPAAMHWDGQTWRLVPTPTYAFAEPKPPEGSAGLDAVAALSGDNVWAVGEHTFNHGEADDEPDDPPPILLHWDGRQWTKRSAPESRYCCPKLAGDGSGGVLLAAGGPWFQDTWRLDAAGRRTHLPRLPAVPELKRSQFFGLEALADVPRTGTVWAVGRLEADGGFWRRAVIAQYH
ncbi:hypothetical protein ABT294_31050 [Nonomuraea sp. NPDC000554]|uniref:hypothetical protein n=1 Tax=Nonomuraea sp. NPDC000554 TaxID=3154259 RepID=UPI003333341F